MHSTHLSEINTELSVDESTLEKKYNLLKSVSSIFIPSCKEILDSQIIP